MEPITNIKEELEKLLKQLEDEYLNWYTRYSIQSTRIWHVLQVIAVLPGFITGIFAAITKAENFNQNQLWLVIIPVVGSLAGTLLTQFKIYEVWKIREGSRVAFEALFNEARGSMCMAKTDEQFCAIYDKISKKINDIETDALQKYFALSSSEFVAKFQKITPG